MSIILSKTLVDYTVDGVDAFRIYELNRTASAAGNLETIQDLGSPTASDYDPNDGTFMSSWIGYYPGTGIEQDIHNKSLGEYATILEIQPGIPRGSLRSLNLDIEFNNVSGFNPGVSGVVGLNYGNQPGQYSTYAYLETSFLNSPPIDFGGSSVKNFVGDPDFKTRVDLSALVSGLINSNFYNENTYLYLAFQTPGEASTEVLRSMAFDSATITYYAVPPSEPLLPKASGGDASAFLTWQVPLDDGGDPVNGYTVEYYNQTANTGWALFSTAISGVSTTVTNLVNDNEYYFRVAARNRAGSSLFSDVSNTVIPEEPIFVTPLDFNHANYTRIRIRRDISSNWTGINPILAIGEVAYETDTRLLKVGDNITEWNALDYVKVDNSSIDFPAPPPVTLTIGNSSVNADTPQISCNLTNNEKINIVGTDGITVNYDNSFKSVTFSLDKVFAPFSTGTLHSPSTRGRPGEVYYDENYIYLCVDVNSWKRISLPSEIWFSADGIEISNIDGNYSSDTNVYFSGTYLIVTSDGDPYPAKAGSSLVNDGVTPRGTFFNNYTMSDQDYNFQLQYRGGTNTSSPEIATTGFNGVFNNGVILSAPGASGVAVGVYNAPSGFVYDRSFFSSFFEMDDCGGYVTFDNKYTYYNGKFLNRCWDDSKVYNSNPYYSGSNYAGDYFRHSNGHSKILGFSFDGYPIYGPFGYEYSDDADSSCVLMTSSYITKPTDEHRPADWKYTNAIAVNDISYNLTAGAFLQDYEFAEGSGLLDQYNGRYSVTPEYPGGTYAYYLTFTSSSMVVPKYPYVIGTFTKQKKVSQDISPSLVASTVDGYFPVFLDANAASNYGLLNGGDGTYHTHTINGQLYYMPNGVPFVHPSAPTDLTLSTTSISEKAAVSSIVGTLTTTDSNTNDTFTYSLVEGANDTDNDNFTITNNELRTNTILSYGIKPIHNIRLKTTDQTNRFFEKPYTINVLESATFTSLNITSGVSLLLAGSGLILGSTFEGTATDLEYNWSMIGSPYVSGTGSATETFYPIGTTNIPERNDETFNISLTVYSPSAYTTLTATTSILLDHSESPVCVNGYYPLYSSEYDSNRDPNGNGTSHQHTVDGVAYWMPNGLSNDYHGDFDCDSLTPNKTDICLDGSIDVTVANTGDGNKYIFDGNPSSDYRFKANTGTYVFNNVPSNHPIAFHNNAKPIAYSGTTSVGSKTALDDNTYTFYYGSVTGIFTGDFSTTSYECYYHGYMGGQNNLIYDNSCTSPLPTLTEVNILSLSAVNGGSGLTLTASKVGTATDVTYSWSISSATGATLSSTTGLSTTLNTTDLDTDTDQDIVVTLTATSVAAATTVSTTKTITVVQSSDSSTSTLTSVTISSNTTVNGGSNVALSASTVGTATDVIYAWSINSVNGTALSSSSGSTTTLTTTDLNTDTDQTVIVTVQASSVSASSTVSDTQTITIYQSSDGGGGGGYS